MATAHGSTTHLSTGPLPATAPISADELKEYERILKISDEIFAGSHPRLKVPQQFVRKPVARNSQHGHPAQQVAKSKHFGVPAGNVPVSNTAQRPQTSQAPPAAGNAPTTSVLNAAAPPFRMAPKPTSEIDPIFLTKSDDLVRAEIQLQRQRVERTLRDQIEQKKLDSKLKPAIQDTKPDFDVSDVLDRALEIVRPVSLSDPSEVNGPNDSFDENSFYSSRAPDSPQPAGAHRKSSPAAPAQPLSSASRVPVDHYADELQRLEALNRSGSDQEMHDAYPVVDQLAPNPSKPTLSYQPKASGHLHELQLADAPEEPEYSPPAPVAPPTDPRHYERMATGDDRGRYADRTQGIQGVTSPATNVKVVRNHITSPAAPRPSRVSPLATAKVPSVQQLRGGRPERGSEQVYSDPDSGRASPSGPAHQVMSRKRRKLHGKEDTRLVSHKSQNAGPSDAYIKAEPVSPPPFADDPAVNPSRHPQERPVYIDIASPQYTPVVERHEPSVRGPAYELNPYHEIPAEQGTLRAVSQLGDRRVVRDDSDLRRVTTMQYARQPEYPRGYVETEPRGGRAASYAVVERLPQERPRYYEEVPSSYGPRYITVDDGHQPAYQDPYYEEHPPVRVMAAPERRFVVDEHGNRFEMVPAPRMQSMAPPPRPMSRAPKADVYSDHVPVRTASARAPSVIQDPYGEHRYVQEMPPPPPTYRRVVSDYARPVAGERRAYATPLESHDPYAPSEGVQLAEYVPRRPAYVEDHAQPLERVIRTSSVRPQPVRYEEPLEVVQRVGSVRPVGPSREVSVFLDDRQRGEYIERPYYVREQRYYEGDDGNRMALDGPADSVQRAQPRY
ncbi:uncharacterized protein N7473_002636 [Penicillium subrubescens]|uniref:Uncharacterized protein n=1 Tax=Penicillium subrubescens TaxID=1316194 RepID=A0A1Q5UKM6_9EURO|nr:uncharacterized protein N7473_002636 [Penicillium subrubescens]KAJ5905720.1 hypothetical protein N7473_002636 [Penicillium subrubescens]OKP13036.1 hypothetical protein PENSUB_1136 [Penicillium subrubescens]